MELIRKILVAMVDHPQPTGTVPLEFEGYSEQDVSYHVKLLADKGLIEAASFNSRAGLKWKAKRLTWDGHDFIEAIRDDERWSRVRRWVADAGKILTLETAKEAVRQLFM
jgi:hypothetical protein